MQYRVNADADSIFTGMQGHLLFLKLIQNQFRALSTLLVDFFHVILKQTFSTSGVTMNLTSEVVISVAAHINAIGVVNRKPCYASSFV
ncbi:hypothetical protein OIU79_026525 [Salix purpurea]|nr:hypothetical protein OIU79_026525 [Salix purpurea]KAJ6753702.1 hypothetical protein OIU79_026525 [Salix purpurea]